MCAIEIRLRAGTSSGGCAATFPKGEGSFLVPLRGGSRYRLRRRHDEGIVPYAGCGASFSVSSKSEVRSSRRERSPDRSARREAAVFDALRKGKEVMSACGALRRRCAAIEIRLRAGDETPPASLLIHLPFQGRLFALDIRLRRVCFLYLKRKTRAPCRAPGLRLGISPR